MTDINKIRDEKLTEDEKMEIIADYLENGGGGTGSDGGVHILTEDDYNYIDEGDDYIALWKLEDGFYRVSKEVRGRLYLSISRAAIGYAYSIESTTDEIPQKVITTLNAKEERAYLIAVVRSDTGAEIGVAKFSLEAA